MSAASRSTPSVLATLLASGIRQQADRDLGERGDRVAVRLHPHRVDHGVRAAPVRQVAELCSSTSSVRSRVSTPCRSAIARRSGTGSTPITR